MSKAYSRQSGDAHIVGVIILAIALLSMLGFAFWSSVLRPNADISQDSTTSLIKGKITQKRTSCGKEILDSNGKPKRVAGICDAGNGIIVDEMPISTGGGALTSNPPEYITDIEAIHAGDIVEVRYIRDEDGYASTDCESCYIKKEGASQKEPQNKQNRR